MPNHQGPYLYRPPPATGACSLSSAHHLYAPQLKPEAEAEYRAIHAAVWPGVLAALERYHIVDYSIHYYPPLQLLVANFKYVGSDYDADMRGIGEDPETQVWWKVTDRMQESFVPGATGSGGPVPWWQVSRTGLLPKASMTIYVSFRNLRRSSGSRGRRSEACVD